MAVLGSLDVARARPEDVDAAIVEGFREVIGNLASHGNYQAPGALVFVDVEDALQGQLFEVEAVRDVVVRRHRLRVVVDDDGAVPGGSTLAHTRDGGPIEFHGRPDTVGAAAQDDDGPLRVAHVGFVAVVRHVQVIRPRRHLAAQRIDLLDDGHDSQCDSRPADAGLGAPRVPRQLGVAEPRLFQLPHGPGPDGLDPRPRTPGGRGGPVLGGVGCGGEAGLHGDAQPRDATQLGQEPLVDLRQAVDLVDRVPFFESQLHREEPLVVRHPQPRLQPLPLRLAEEILIRRRRGGLLLSGVVFACARAFRRRPSRRRHCAAAAKKGGPVVLCGGGDEAFDAREVGVDHAYGLLDSLFEGASDGHDLSDGFHGRAEFRRDPRELAHVPPRYLDDAVVEGGLEAGRRRLGHGVADGHEVVAERKLRGDVRQGESRRLGRESRGPRQASVHLDDAIGLALGVQGVLDVTLADDAEVPHDLESRGP
mmetsp:Transcript_22121/g.71241  ORF Transcript_22121/g.71241 Transcript_22121/m.71241 type:complete len:479 (+) Transcript_22121:1785-3221(+)